jgi:hypothetical protein
MLEGQKASEEYFAKWDAMSIQSNTTIILYFFWLGES